MILFMKRLYLLLILLFGNVLFSQSFDRDSLKGDFTYLLKAKLNTKTPNYVYEEFFSLLVSDKYAFFASTPSLKKDTVLENASITTKNPDGSITLSLKKGITIPKTKFHYTIIQSNENVQYFEPVAMSVLTYKEPIIKNWILTKESKVINTINCKKAEINFKGRNWIAWYSPEIPLPYGPYKFSGLPGLIVKITDDKGDYDFELVKALPTSKLKGKLINIKKSRYNESVETTQPKFEKALRNAKTDAISFLASYGTTIIKGQDIIRKTMKEREENMKYENPLELSN